MPAVWLIVLSLPGVGVLIGIGVMYAVHLALPVDWAGFIAGVLGINLLLDLALVRLHRRGLGAPTAHDQVGRLCRVAHPGGGDSHDRVMLDGVRWRARSIHSLHAGQQVRVIGRDGLTLEVEPAQVSGSAEVSPNRNAG